MPAPLLNSKQFERVSALARHNCVRRPDRSNVPSEPAETICEPSRAELSGTDRIVPWPVSTKDLHCHQMATPQRSRHRQAENNPSSVAAEPSEMTAHYGHSATKASPVPVQTPRCATVPSSPQKQIRDPSSLKTVRRKTGPSCPFSTKSSPPPSDAHITQRTSSLAEMIREPSLLNCAEITPNSCPSSTNTLPLHWKP